MRNCPPSRSACVEEVRNIRENWARQEVSEPPLCFSLLLSPLFSLTSAARCVILSFGAATIVSLRVRGGDG